MCQKLCQVLAVKTMIKIYIYNFCFQGLSPVTNDLFLNPL